MNILEEYPKARNSDIELSCLYFEKFVCENKAEARIYRELLERASMSPAGIVRERAYIQNNLELFLSDKQVKKMRERLEEEKRYDYSPHPDTL